MPATWPPTIRTGFAVPSYNQTVRPNSIRTNIPAGIDKVRRRYTKQIVIASGTIIITNDQMAVLDSFYANTLDGGTLSFYFPEATTGDFLTHRFIDPPKYTAIGGPYFNAFLNLERYTDQ